MSYIDALPSDEESCYYAEHLELRPDPATTSISGAPLAALDRPPPAVTDDQLAAIIPHCPNLTSAVLSGVPDLSSRTLILLAQSAPRLAHLDISGCTGVTAHGLHALAAHGADALTSVALNRVRGVTDPALARLVRGLPRLARLEMDALPLVTAVAVRDVWIFGRALRNWSMAGCLQVTDSGFPWVLDCERLRGPFLEDRERREEGGGGEGGVGEAVDEGTAGTETGSARRKTWLESLPPLVLPATHKLNELRALDLSHCIKLTDAAILGVVAHAPRIQHLALAGCIELTDRAMHAVCALGGHLTAIDIAGLERVTDEGAFALASACRRLQVVDISFIHSLSDLAVLELAALPRLQRLAAAGLPRLTDNAVCFLAEHAAALETLHLSYCAQLTLDGVRALLRRLGKLEHLGLCGVPALGRRGVRRFSEAPPEGYDEGKQGVYRVFRAGNVRALGEFLEKEEWRRREAERVNVLFQPRGDDSRALY
ncbi:RNI-like protein [Trametes punicea]|nr:RNI-like protein [Trametes punicea]